MDKTINLGHLLTTLTITASVFMWGSSVEKRVSLLELRQDQQEIKLSDVTEEIKDVLREIKQDVKDIHRNMPRPE